MRLNSSLLFIVILFTSTLFTTAAFSMDLSTLTPMQRGKYHFFSKDYQQAYEAFYEAFMEDPTEPEVSFYLGRAAFEKGDYETAVMSFDRILIMEPNSMRIKLELARSHLQLGSKETAKQYFYEVLAANPPKHVRANIDIFLAAIAASEKRHYVSGMLAYGVSWDDNVRTSPGDFIFEFAGSAGNIQFPLSAEPVNDQLEVVTLVLNHIYQFEDRPFAWKTSATTFNNFYDYYKDLNVNYFGISTGPVYQRANSVFEMHASLSNLLVAADEYVQPSGLGASLTYLFHPQFVTIAAVELEKKKYSKPADNGKNATNLKFTVAPVYTFGDNRLTLTLSKERENAKTEAWGYDRHKEGLRYDRTLPRDFTVYASYDITTTHYDAVLTGNPLIRSDTVDTFGIGISKLLWQAEDKSRSLTGQLSNSYTESQSNIGIYGYKKNVTASSLTLTF